MLLANTNHIMLHTISDSIVQIEQLKQNVTGANQREQFVTFVDIALSYLKEKKNELYVNQEAKEAAKNALGRLELLKFQFQENRLAQIEFYAKDVNMTLAVLQFCIWDKSNNELYDLLDNVSAA